MARKKQIIKHISKPVSECLEIFIKHCQTKNLSTDAKNHKLFDSLPTWSQTDLMLYLQTLPCLETGLNTF